MKTLRLLLALATFVALLVPAAVRAECGGTTQCIGVGPTVAAALLANHGGGPDTFTIDFGGQPVGSASGSRTIFVEAVTGPVGTMAQLSPTTITGADAGSFSITGGTCSPSNGPVHGGSGCTITVGFTPASTGAKSATVHVNLASPGCVGCITERIVTVIGTGTLPAPVITSPLTATGTVGTAFAGYQITATNSPTSFSAAPLPAGLSVNGSGFISGTPTAAGTTNTVITATNATGTDTKTLVFTINVPPPAITSPNTASGTGGQPFSYQITATNSPASFGATGLPAGVAVDTATGLISGVPSVSGTFNATVSATNASGTGSQAVTITIGLAAPAITSPATASGIGGQPFSYQITASNLPSSFGATNLPPGLSVSTSTGLISGTPTSAGTFNATITASNAAGSGSQPLAITITLAAPVITSPNTATATSGMPFTYQITASNLPASFGASGLPTGLAVNAATGLISGTPIVATPGNYPITVTATNAAGTGSQVVTLQIAVAAPVITSAATASGAVSQPFSYQITATNFPTSFGAAGLPAGLSVNTGTGVISGSPTVAGVFNATVTATNSVGTGSQPVTITIALLPPVITSPAMASGTVLQSFSYQITASNSPTSFGASGLPAGLSVNPASGLISGIPTVAGTFPAMVSASNASGSGSQTLTITIGNIPAPIAGRLFIDVPFQTPATINLAVLVSGSFSSISIATQPAHGTVSLSGSVATYTPAAGFSGVDQFTYVATGVGGASEPGTVTINVGAPPAPSVAARSVSVPFETPTTIDLRTSTSGTFSSIAVVSPPQHGTVSGSGGVVTYTPNPGFFGSDSFTYAATGPGGTSQPATVSIAVETVPLGAGPATMTVPLNTATTLDLLPFISGSGVTRVNVVTRPSHGTAVAVGTRVTYTPALDYFGPDAFTYAAVGIAGTSAPATVSITVVGRPDPGRNPAVTGLLAAQAASAERFSQAQVANVQGRMESLHRRETTAARSASFLHSSYASSTVVPTATEALALLATGSVSLARNWANFWVSGTARFGERGATGTRSGLDFTTSGITVGVDGRLSERLAVGAGVGYGRDRTDIGADGSVSRARGASLAAYASYQPTPRSFVDTIVGIGSLDFKSRRFVAPVNDFASSERDGDYVFASIAAGYEHRANGVLFSPYARLDHASATLDGATESGAGVYALTYARQRSPATQGALGLRAETVHETEGGWANARARVEYRRSLRGPRSSTIAYADVPGTLYLYSPERSERNAFVLGLGTELILRNGLTTGIEYQLLRGSSRDSDQGIRIYLSQDLDGRGNAGWLSAFRLEPTAPRDIQVDAGFTYDDNVARSQRAVDELSDWSFGANVRLTEIFDLSRNVRGVASGLLGAERFRDFSRLGRATAGLEGEIQYRPSGEFGAPTFAAFAQGYVDAYESRLRDGSRFNLGVSVRKALTDRLTGFGALAHTRRQAESGVFDATEYSGRANLDYQWSAKDTFYLTGEYRRGHVVGTGRPPSLTNPFPHSHDFTNIALAVDDDVFPGYVAYRFKAGSTIATLGYNRALGPRHSLDLSWRRVETKARPGWGIETLYGTVIMSRYVTNQYLLLYLLSF